MPRHRINHRLLLCWIFVSCCLVLFFWQATSQDRAIAARTIGLGLAAAAIAIPLGGCLSWICLGPGWLARPTLLITLMLLTIPVFLHVSTWDAAFGRLGWLTSTEGQVLIPLVSGWQAAAWIHGVAAAPQVAILLLIGLSNRRQPLEEQTLLDTNWIGVFWYVTLRRLWPLILLSTLWTLIVCSREIAATDLYQVGTLAEQIYLGYSLGQINAIGGNWSAEQLAEAARLNGYLTLAIVLWLAASAGLLFVWLTDPETDSEHRRPTSSPIQNSVSKRVNRFQAILALALLLILVVVPLGNLVARCCYFVRPLDGVPVGSFAFSQLILVLQRACFGYSKEFSWSVLIGLSASVVIFCLAAGLAWLARISRGWQMFFVLTLALSCTIPGPMIGSSINTLFSQWDWPPIRWLYNRTIFAPVLANICFCWPLAPLVVWFVFRKIATGSLEASQLDGAGQGTMFLRFGLMGNWPAMLGCWLITLAFCLGELSASQLVLPPGIDTIPRLMLGLLHAGVDEMSAALTVLMIGLIGLISILGWATIEYNRRRMGSQSLVHYELSSRTSNNPRPDS